MKNSRMQHLAARWVLAVLLALPALTGALAAEPPRVSIASVDRIEWKNNRATLDLTLEVGNPSGVDVTVSALKFNCVFGDVAKASGESRLPITIAANARANIPVRVTVSGDSLLALAVLVSNGSSLDYRLDGTALLGPMAIEVPFSRVGHLALPH